jgi:3-hydroxyacyl-CoA dehydrogenase
MLAIETVVVLGSGEAAHRCAILAALAGCTVRLHVPSPDILDEAFEAVRFQVDMAIELGVLTRTDRQRILDGILVTPDLVEAATGADLVIRPAAGSADRAAELHELMDLVRATAALAAPTLEAAVGLAERVPAPGRVLALAVDTTSGLARVAIAATPITSRHTLAAVEDFAARVNARGRHEA